MGTAENSGAGGKGDPWRLLFRWAVLTWLAVISLGCCFGPGFVFGLLKSTGGKYNEQYHRERILVEPILAKDPASAGVEIHMRSNGGIYLLGQVPTAQDCSRLRESVIRAVGAPRAKEILLAVHARSGNIDPLR